MAPGVARPHKARFTLIYERLPEKVTENERASEQEEQAEPRQDAFPVALTRAALRERFGCGLGRSHFSGGCAGWGGPNQFAPGGIGRADRQGCGTEEAHVQRLKALLRATGQEEHHAIGAGVQFAGHFREGGVGQDQVATIRATELDTKPLNQRHLCAGIRALDNF